MVYIASWSEFQEAAEGLYENSPVKTRYSVKWRASDGKLVLKITDNITCLKFKTSHSLFLNRFEALNHTLMQKMANRHPPPAPVAAPPRIASAASTGGAGAAVREGTPMETDAPGATGIAGTTSGGVKKKKPKKKK